MAIRITKTEEADQTVLKVAGWFKAEDVEELTRVYQSVPGSAALDLSELQSADQEGIETLRELLSLGAEVRGATRYVELLLKDR